MTSADKLKLYEDLNRSDMRSDQIVEYMITYINKKESITNKRKEKIKKLLK
jgi:hypothetical protein